MDSKCSGEDGWDQLFKAGEWVPMFKRLYKTDDDLKGILTTVGIGFDTAKTQLKERVGEGIGIVLDEIVNKLKELFDKGAAEQWVQPASQ